MAGRVDALGGSYMTLPESECNRSVTEGGWSVVQSHSCRAVRRCSCFCDLLSCSRASARVRLSRMSATVRETLDFVSVRVGDLDKVDADVELL
jgi:hypothetical protein